jgi:hypothetical protein
MSTSDSYLDPATHARVFVDDIIQENGLNETTSQARPRAIILGGQPGAGKGRLEPISKS